MEKYRRLLAAIIPIRKSNVAKPVNTPWNWAFWEGRDPWRFVGDFVVSRAIFRVRSDDLSH